MRFKDVKVNKAPGLIISLLPIVFFYVVWKLRPSYLCGMDLCDGIFIEYLIPLYSSFAVLAVVSIILSFFKDIIFYAWFKFAALWIPLTVILIITSSQHSRSFGIFPSVRESIGFFFPIIFVVISTAILGWKWSSMNKNKLRK